MFNPVQTNQRPVREKIAQRVWEFVRPIVFGCSPWFARGWRVLLVQLASKCYGGAANISSGCSIARTSRIDYPWNFSVGDRSSVGAHAWVYCLGEVPIGRYFCAGGNPVCVVSSRELKECHV